MALTRADHKRIALHVADELKKVLSAKNGERILAKHKARTAPKAPPPPEPGEPDADDLESALAAPPGEPMESDDAMEGMDEAATHGPKAKAPKKPAFPPRRG